MKTIRPMHRLLRYTLIGTFVLLGLAATDALADTGKIAGTIADKEAGEPLPGANVLITARWEGDEAVPMVKTRGAAANEEGNYFIIDLRPGTYNVKVSYIGFQTVEKTKVQVSSNQTTWVDFELSSDMVSGEEVIVVAYRPGDVQLDQTSTKQSYNVDQVSERVPGVTDVSDLLALQADVVDGHFRGGREGEAQFVLNGSSIVNPLNNRSSFEPMLVGLEEVEVYTSGFSAEFGNAQSGVVNLVPKEGGDSWKTSVDVSGALPFHRTWGGSYYDPDNLPSYLLLMDTEEWLEPSPDDAGQAVFGNQWNSYLPSNATRNDSLRVAELAKKQFLALTRLVGLEHGYQPEYRFDISTGGPVTEDVRVFIAARQESEATILPHPEPLVNRQVMGNVTFQPLSSDKFTFSTSWSLGVGPDVSSGTHERFAFNRILFADYLDRRSLDYGLQWKHIFSNATFMEWRLRRFATTYRQRIPWREPGDYSGKSANLLFTSDNRNPTNFKVLYGNQWADEDTRQYNVIGSVTSQVNAHLIKAGLQTSFYAIDVHRELNLENVEDLVVQDFNQRPMEGALYIQDKMEFEGMVTNVGLRLDFYDFNTIYFSDRYSPLRNPNYDPDAPYLERGPYYSRELAAQEESELFVALSPRFGISFPITERSVIHANYGRFIQRPPFEYIFYDEIRETTRAITELGNPRLRPEETTSYDVGLVQGLPFGATLEFSMYYKDVKNLMEQVFYLDSQQNIFPTYENMVDAAIKGFHVNLEKSFGSASIMTRYNYQEAIGQSSSPFDATFTFREDPPLGVDEVDLPEPEDIYLDFDRKHRLVTAVAYATGHDAGPEILGIRPLADIQMSVRYRMQTGRPFTWDTQGLGLKHNRRTPTEHDLTLKLRRRARFGDIRFDLYFEGFNMLNLMEYRYGRVFNNPDYTSEWMTDREDLWFSDDNAPYVFREDVALISNLPRHYRFGFKMNF